MRQTLDGGYRLERVGRALVARFGGPRRTLSTAALGGGLRGDLTAAFNHNDCEQAGRYCAMQGETMAEHQAGTARQLGLDPACVTGLNTGANMDNAALHTLREGDWALSVLATAGVEVNACRAGDPATLDERGGRSLPVLGGTVNLLVFFDADLSDGALVRALVTATEAKAAVFQELLVSSRYSNGIATGSGTDGAVLCARPDSPVKLSEAGGHFRLGERLANAVRAAVREALYRQSGLCAQGQHALFRRLERFGLTEEALWAAYAAATPRPVERAHFRGIAAELSADGFVVSVASLYAHLLDQLDWGLLLPGEAADAAERLLDLLGEHHAVPRRDGIARAGDRHATARHMLDALTAVLVEWLVCSGL